jgi:hypothetical protein
MPERRHAAHRVTRLSQHLVRRSNPDLFLPNPQPIGNDALIDPALAVSDDQQGLRSTDSEKDRLDDGVRTDPHRLGRRGDRRSGDRWVEDLGRDVVEANILSQISYRQHEGNYMHEHRSGNYAQTGIIGSRKTTSSNV